MFNDFTVPPIIKKIAISRAVVYTLGGKVWGILSGFVTLALISHFFSSDYQGYYYTFLSLLAFQIFFDLSLSTILVNFSAHEWSHLSFNEKKEVYGDTVALSRLAHLVRFSFRWYSVLALTFSIIVGIAGYAFLLKKGDPGINWQGPWIALVVIAGGQLAILPHLSTLEGCGQIARVSFIRLMGSVIGSLMFWWGLTFGLGLWSTVLMFGLSLLVQLWFLTHFYRNYFRSLFKVKVAERISWRREIFPLQWRLGVAGVVNYFATAFFTPLMFWYHGAKVAGQMGMGWQIMGAAQAVALTWVYATTPTFGALISKKEYESLDRLFKRVTLISLGILVLISGIAWMLVNLLFVANHSFSTRCMAPAPLLLFLLAAICMHVPQCQAAYLRAHKKEPLFVIGLIASGLTGGLVWWFGKNFGLAGVGGAYLAVTALVLMPGVFNIWKTKRDEWHG